ncbi:SPFH domain-containing protein [Streptosporangium sp. H16]|uniref:SPFH domain-containing protein n=1 Tax=Streptosporangium sp. H16 TaxID=3444184 RepID=UPI003F7A2581
MRPEVSFGQRLLAALARLDDINAPSAQTQPVHGRSFGWRLLGALARWDPEPPDVTVPIGMIGVVVTPDGVLPDPMPEGSTYQPSLKHVVLIPARVLFLRWADDHNPDDYDIALEPLLVIVQGFRLRVEMGVLLRIPASAAPALVSAFGEDLPVQRFVERVLDPVVRARFLKPRTLEELLVGYERLRADLTATLTETLAARGVQLQALTMGAANPDDPALTEALRQIAAAEIEGRAVAIVTNEEIQLRETTTSPDGGRRLEELILLNKIEQISADAVAAPKLLQDLVTMQVPRYVRDGDARFLLDTMSLDQARELVQRVLRETATERAHTEENS